MLALKPFMEEVTKTVIILAIVKRNMKVDLKVPKEIQPMIEEYHDLTLGLPPESDIHHHIDLVGDKLKQWDLAMPQAKFAFNGSQNRTTERKPIPKEN